MTIKTKNFLVFLVILFATIVFLYRKAPNFFFQQDEWLSFNDRIVTDGNFAAIIEKAFPPTVGHFIPLNVLVLSGLFSAFHINYAGYAVVSVTLHFLSALLVFFLALLIFDDFRISCASSFLFAVWASSYQATSWAVADIGVHGATIFGLLAVISLFIFLKKHAKKFYFLTIVFLCTSLLFREIAVGLFALLPLAVCFYSGFPSRKKINLIAPFLVLGLIYFMFRGSMLIKSESYATEKLATQSLTTEQLLINFITLPVKTLSQSVVPYHLFSSTLNSGRTFLLSQPQTALFFGPYIREGFGDFIEYFYSGLFSTSLFTFLILVSLFTWLRHRHDKTGRNVIFFLLWIFLNSYIFAFAPERNSLLTVIDSRYLYFLSIGSVFLILQLLVVIFSKRKISARVICLILLMVNILSLENSLANLEKQGVIRRGILEKISFNYPHLPEKVIFYTESDKSFYGLDPSERVLPFLSGFGQTLLVWYSDKDRFPEPFYQGKFLWDITSQGYEVFAGRGFGYFRDFDRMIKTVKENNLGPANVIGFRFNSLADQIIDNTDEVRRRIAALLK